ncbi:MAG TPA: DUF3999 family protein [Burkholderiaceae bacterium]|nr:DUF3999 family protein [Burkholderiaceae bacterium]
MRLLAALCACAALLPLPSFGAPDRLEDYAAVATVAVHSSDGLHRLELPLEVLQASRSAGYADVRLFDARGEPLPLAWAQRPAIPPGAERHVRVPVFAWPAATAGESRIKVQVDDSGAVVRIVNVAAAPAKAPVPAAWLLDLSRLDRQGERITRLALDWPPQPGGIATGVRVEGSDDTRSWIPITHASLLDLAQSGAPALKQVDWPAARAAPARPPQAPPRYLRLVFDTPLPLGMAEVTLNQAPAGPPLASQRVTFMAAEGPQPELEGTRPRGTGATRPAGAQPPWGGPASAEPRPWELDLKGRVPVSRLRVHLPQTNTVVPLRLQQRDDPRRPWRTVVSLVAWRLTRNGQELQAPATAFEAASARYWQLVPDARSAGWNPATLEATLEWTAPQIVFAARGLAAQASGALVGTPLHLAVGRDVRGPPPLALAALIPGYEPGAEHLLPAASLSALTPQQVAPLPLPERLRRASPDDQQRWTLWLVLVLAVTGLGWMAWKLVREVNG